MELITNYIKPELLAVSAVLYFVGVELKRLKIVKGKYIPLVLGGTGILLCALYVVGTSSLHNFQEISLAVFTAIVQGILVAGLSTYVDQIIKQSKKPA